MSNLHVHRAFNQVDANVWSSGRILDVLVPVNCHLTFRFLVVYLPAKSKDNPMRLQEANCIMNEVHKRIVMSDFPRFSLVISTLKLNFLRHAIFCLIMVGKIWLNSVN